MIEYNIIFLKHTCIWISAWNDTHDYEVRHTQFWTSLSTSSPLTLARKSKWIRTKISTGMVSVDTGPTEPVTHLDLLSRSVRGRFPRYTRLDLLPLGSMTKMVTYSNWSVPVWICTCVNVILVSTYCRDILLLCLLHAKRRWCAASHFWMNPKFFASFFVFFENRGALTISVPVCCGWTGSLNRPFRQWFSKGSVTFWWRLLIESTPFAVYWIFQGFYLGKSTDISTETDFNF